MFYCFFRKLNIVIMINVGKSITTKNTLYTIWPTAVVCCRSVCKYQTCLILVLDIGSWPTVKKSVVKLADSGLESADSSIKSNADPAKRGV